MGLKSIITAGAVISLTNITFAMADIKVVTSIKPVHSLVSGVMLGVGNPSLIIDGAGSPHTYSLKPSQAKHQFGILKLFCLRWFERIGMRRTGAFNDN